MMLISLVNMGMSITDTAMVPAMFGTKTRALVAVGSDLYSSLFYLGAGVLTGISPFYTAEGFFDDSAIGLATTSIALGLLVLLGVMELIVGPEASAAGSCEGGKTPVRRCGTRSAATKPSAHLPRSICADSSGWGSQGSGSDLRSLIKA